MLNASPPSYNKPEQQTTSHHPTTLNNYKNNNNMKCSVIQDIAQTPIITSNNTSSNSCTTAVTCANYPLQHNNNPINPKLEDYPPQQQEEQEPSNGEKQFSSNVHEEHQTLPPFSFNNQDIIHMAPEYPSQKPPIHAYLSCIEPQFTLYEPSLDPLVCMSTIFKPNSKLAVIDHNKTSQMLSHKHPMNDAIEPRTSTFVQSKKIFEPSYPLSTNYEAINVVDSGVHQPTTVFPSIPSSSSLASSSSSTHIHHPPNASIASHLQNGANTRMHASVLPTSPLLHSPILHVVPSPSMVQFPISNVNTTSSRIAKPKINDTFITSSRVGHASSNSLNSTTQDFHLPTKQLKKLDTETGKKSSPTQQGNLYEEDSSSPLHNEEDSDESIEDVTLEETMMRCSPYKKITTSETGDVQINHGTWSKEEHEMFLLGLKEAGRNWELIANKYIKSRVRSQVASHEIFQKD
ncbi:SANT domain-containing protein [Naegleria gruberi]|uniref:SANT domain-containing protein n=1 Tax=Naegleria gruberi TaxID=5762 RepID=D2W1T0_NAEGR|nr:SANT domain-containing protein [Naegleria gruberi]EFC37019.1 SANT domain-containing protein [Naegleria gruberi]|eukprot:XP_002669763.1 SANT domain-containing protein [Naegleria gruberi strain NEG-M]